MELDGNLEALKKYENSIQEKEIAYEKFSEEFIDSSQYLMDQIISNFDKLSSKYPELYLDFDEVLHDLLEW